jgi:hypothetical protein
MVLPQNNSDFERSENRKICVGCQDEPEDRPAEPKLEAWRKEAGWEAGARNSPVT